METWRIARPVMINWDEQLRLVYAGKLLRHCYFAITVSLLLMILFFLFCKFR